MAGPARRRSATRSSSKGYDPERGTFTQHYDTLEVDASLLNISLVGFLPGDDPRVLGTIRAIEEDLAPRGLLRRYRTDTGVDGLSGDEHPFLACSFWLVSAYARAGRLDDAHALLDRLCALANDVGLLSEEYDVDGERMAATSRRRSATSRWCRRRSRWLTRPDDERPPPRARAQAGGRTVVGRQRRTRNRSVSRERWVSSSPR